MYPNENDEDKETIEEAKVKYMVTFNTSLGEIHDQFPNVLKSILSSRRQEAISEDAKIKKFSLDKIGSSLAHEDKLKLDQLYNKKFRIRKGVSTLMRIEKEYIARLKNETLQNVVELSKESGALSDSGDQMQHNTSIS